MNKKILILYGFICLVAGVVGTTPLLSFLLGFIPSNISLVTLNPFDGINTLVMVGFGIFFVLFNIGFFAYLSFWIQDALTTKEKELINPLFMWAIILFVVGLVFGFFATTLIIFPAMVEINSSLGLTQLWGFSETLVSLVLLSLITGVCFEFPLIIKALIKSNLVKVEDLKKKRLFVLVGVFVLVNLVTPTGDLFTSLVFGVPLYILFEVGLL